MRKDRAKRHFADKQMRTFDAHAVAGAGRSTRLGPHEPYDVNPGEVMFVTPNALLYAQLDLFVSFQPWKISWSFSRASRFETRRLSDGTIQWFHIPSD